MRLKSSFSFLLALFYALVGVSSLQASEYSLRVAYGVETDSDLGQILTLQKPSDRKYDFDVIALDAGYLLKPSLNDWPVDLYIKGGVALFRTEDLSIYDELKQMQDVSDKDVYEFTLYVKLYYNIDFLSNRVRIGFGEGGSYVSDYLAAEVIEERSEDGDDAKYSKYLNYLDISFDIDLGKLVKAKWLEETYLGYTIKHRSGIFGLINGVSGGSNYNTVSIERNF